MKAALALSVLVLGSLGRVGASDCIGDCDGDGRVTVSELIVGVDIALGVQPVDACRAFEDAESQVNVSQLIKGIGNALGGCPGVPTPAATPTPRKTPTPTRPPKNACPFTFTNAGPLQGCDYTGTLSWTCPASSSFPIELSWDADRSGIELNFFPTLNPGGAHQTTVFATITSDTTADVVETETGALGRPGTYAATGTVTILSSGRELDMAYSFFNGECQVTLRATFKAS